MPFVSVVLSPHLLDLCEVKNNIVVAIDILRATTTITAAFMGGVKHIIPVAEVSECITLGAQLGAVTAGERNGQIVSGLQMGNTPLSYITGAIRDKILVITTTNGTKLIHQAEALSASEIWIGSFLSLAAMGAHLRARDKNILLVCAGWKGKVNIEDTLYAGALAQYLVGESHDTDCDSLLLAKTLYEQYRHRLSVLLPQMSHYRRLDRFNLSGDLDFCFQESITDVLPFYKHGKITCL